MRPDSAPDRGGDGPVPYTGDSSGAPGGAPIEDGESAPSAPDVELLPDPVELDAPDAGADAAPPDLLSSEP